MFILRQQPLKLIYILIILPMLIIAPCFAQEKIEDNKIAGEFFGVPVPMGNYYFAKRVVLSFNAKWRGVPQTEEELEDLVWQELLFSYEAFRRGIEATDKEINEEVDKILKAEKVEFNWKEDTGSFKKWVEDKLQEPVELFRNQIEHLVKLEKLRQQVLDSVEPEVTEQEAYQKFIDEYNTLSVELMQFDDLEEAEKFYKEAIRPLSERDLESLIWQELILSYEAFKQGTEVTEDELDKAIEELLRVDMVRFNWKEDEEAFRKWIDEKAGVSQEVFRDRFSHFVKIEKLMQKLHEGKESNVTEKEEYQKFLKKNRTISKAYKQFLNIYISSAEQILRFKSLKEAKNFYKKMDRKPGVWQERKRKEPKLFKRPGFVALDFLIHMWRFNRGDAYKMIEMEEGDFYQPAPVYKGYAVFRILKIRKANPEEFDKRRDYYFDRVKTIKKYEGFKDWVKDLKEQANIKVFIK